MSRILIDHEGPIARVTLNRPDKKNALDFELMDELTEAGLSLMNSEGLRVVVLSGADGCFCAGIDTSSFMKMAGQIEQIRQDIVAPSDDDLGNRFQRPCTVWQALPVPVIAAIEGVAFGAGAQLALAADFRIASKDVQMSIMEARWGLIPDMGITQYLPQLMPADRAKELIMTARRLSANEALNYGLITELAEDPLQAADQMAQTLLRTSPDVLRGTKALVNKTWGSGPQGLKTEAEIQAKIIGYPNQIEAVMAGMQKRDATYKD